MTERTEMAKTKKAKTKGIPQKKEVCILDGCSNPRYSRGLCNACYYACWIARKNGEENEDDLVARGLLLPARRGRKSTSTFAQMTKASRSSKVTSTTKLTTKKVAKKAKKKAKRSKKKAGAK